jgi:hypothetical protein
MAPIFAVRLSCMCPKEFAMHVSARARNAVAHLLLLILAGVAVACARTRATRVQDPAYVGKSFTTPAIFADIADLQNRQLVEEAMVAELERHGVRARAAIHLIPPTRDYVPQERLQMLRGAGVDSLIVITAAWGSTRHYVPVTSSTTQTEGSMDIYGNHAAYQERSRTQYHGGYEVEKPWAKGEFVILDLANGRRAWLGTSETRGEAVASWNDIRKSACARLAQMMVADRIVTAGGSRLEPRLDESAPTVVPAPPMPASATAPQPPANDASEPPALDTASTERVQGFGLIDRKCQMQYVAANGEFKSSRPGDRMASSCLRKGKNIRCTLRGQNPETTFEGSKTTELELAVFFDEEDFTMSKSTSVGGNTFLYIYWDTSKFVLADNVVSGARGVIQKQCWGEVTVVK